MRRRALLALGSALAATSAFALEPPTTARSLATTVPTLLSDESALTFFFPSVAADLGPAAYAYGAVGSEFSVLNDADSGVRVGSRVGNLWYQNTQRPPGVASRTSVYFESAHSQAGWARMFGRLRLGASFSWSASAFRDRETTIRPEPSGQSVEYRAVFNAINIRDGAIGAGWAGAIDVDAVVILGTESFHHERLSRGTDTQSLRVDQDAIRERINTGLRLGGGLRVLLPLGAGARLRVAGSWRDTGNELKYDRTRRVYSNGLLLFEGQEDASRGDGGRELTAGFSVENDAATGAPAWSAYAWYERVRAGWRYDSFFPSNGRRQFRTDRVVTGCSVRHPGPAGIEFLGGLSFEGSRSRERTQRGVDSDLVYHRESLETDDAVDFRYAWGAARKFAHLELTASLRATVPASDPAASLDLAVPF